MATARTRGYQIRCPRGGVHIFLPPAARTEGGVLAGLPDWEATEVALLDTTVPKQCPDQSNKFTSRLEIVLVICCIPAWGDVHKYGSGAPQDNFFFMYNQADRINPATHPEHKVSLWGLIDLAYAYGQPEGDGESCHGQEQT
uniref:Uncharacterized protein n=1 Tax=Oryza meridionalis TaxID=40149 RepID=A0A0E0F2Y7_9ORYZ